MNMMLIIVKMAVVATIILTVKQLYTYSVI